jgi:hypothetical protein
MLASRSVYGVGSVASKTRKRTVPLFASRRRSGGGANLVAVLLCTLALAFNLLGSVAYAEAFRGAVAAGAESGLYVCHSTPEAATPEAATPDATGGGAGGKQAQAAGKCPLCQVSAAGLSAPPIVPLALPNPAAVASDIVPDVFTALLPRLRASRPEPRGPPLFA